MVNASLLESSYLSLENPSQVLKPLEESALLAILAGEPISEFAASEELSVKEARKHCEGAIVAIANAAGLKVSQLKR